MKRRPPVVHDVAGELVPSCSDVVVRRRADPKRRAKLVRLLSILLDTDPKAGA